VVIDGEEAFHGADTGVEERVLVLRAEPHVGGDHAGRVDTDRALLVTGPGRRSAVA
jgi:hypothetical protein